MVDRIFFWEKGVLHFWTMTSSLTLLFTGVITCRWTLQEHIVATVVVKELEMDEGEAEAVDDRLVDDKEGEPGVVAAAVV